MSNDKVEGQEKKCGNCQTQLICVKVISEWKGKKSEKLQWQNKFDGTPHYYYVSPGKYNCSPPKTPEDIVQESMQNTAEQETQSINVITPQGPYQEAELLVSWASDKAYKKAREGVNDINKLDSSRLHQIGQKEGMLTRLYADSVLELMKLHNVKAKYPGEEKK